MWFQPREWNRVMDVVRGTSLCKRCWRNSLGFSDGWSGRAAFLCFCILGRKTREKKHKVAAFVHTFVADLKKNRSLFAAVWPFIHMWFGLWSARKHISRSLKNRAFGKFLPGRVKIFTVCTYVVNWVFFFGLVSFVWRHLLFLILGLTFLAGIFTCFRVNAHLLCSYTEVDSR